MRDNFSQPIRKIRHTNNFSQFINQVDINSDPDRPCCKRDFNPTLIHSLVILDVVCHYLLFSLLYINIEIGKNRC